MVRSLKWLIWIIAAMLFIGLTACSQKEPGKPQAVSEKTSAPVAQEKVTEGKGLNTGVEMPQAHEGVAPEVLMGTVTKVQDQVVLSTNSGEYEVQGQDLSKMVGLTIKVTGAVKEVEGHKIIEVTSAQQME